MACRCQERRAAIKRVLTSKSLVAIQKEIAFIGKSSVEDLTRSVNIRRPKPQKRN